MVILSFIRSLKGLEKNYEKFLCVFMMFFIYFIILVMQSLNAMQLEFYCHLKLNASRLLIVDFHYLDEKNWPKNAFKRLLHHIMICIRCTVLSCQKQFSLFAINLKNQEQENESDSEIL